MSLKQLAGPFDLMDDQGNALAPHTVNPICYYPGFGLVLKIDYAVIGGVLSLVTLDGIAQPISTNDVGGAGGFDPASWRFDMTTSQLITNSGKAREKICLGPVPYVLPSPTISLGANNGSFSPMGCILADRVVFLVFSQFNNNVATEGIIPQGVTIQAANVLPGRTSTEVYIGGIIGTGNTRAVFYDTATRKFTTQVFSLGSATIASYWDVDSGILVTLTNTPWRLTIFSLDVIPVSLSSVTLRSGLVAKGSIAVYQVQVQGDQGDWSVGVLVDWSITSGDGVLLDTQSATGDDGFATCRVFYPTTASVSTVLKASVTC